MSENNGCFVVSWDFNHGKDNDLLIVGKRENGRLNIINAIKGKEAREIYDRLRTVKEENK